MSRRPGLRLLASVLACAGTASCAAVLGFERLSDEAEDAGVAPTTDAGADADAASEAGLGACGELGLPPRPGDAGSTNVPPVLVALRSLDFGVAADGRAADPTGFNLDQTCSFDPASSSCATGLSAATFQDSAGDIGPGGVDNASFDLFAFIGRNSDTLSPKAINGALQRGLYGAIFRVDDWTGSPDDARVRVQVKPSTGLLPGATDAGVLAPSFTREDRWRLDARFRRELTDESKFSTDAAWVTGGVLSAVFAEVTLELFIDNDPRPFDIRLTNFVLRARLQQGDEGEWRLTDGVIGGRWSTKEFLAQVRLIRLHENVAFGTTVVCDGAVPLYATVRDLVCESRDIRSNETEDGQNRPCDAVSVGARFDTYAVGTDRDYRNLDDAGVRCVDSGIPPGDDCPPIQGK